MNKTLEERIADLERRVDILDDPFGKRLGPQKPGPADGGAAIDKILAEIPPVDRSKRVLLGGGPVTEDHREIRPDGMQKDYVVLSAEERAKGFVRPVRMSYIHVGAGGSEINPADPSKPGLKGAGCGVQTFMGRALAETYARDPGFYSGTFCAGCRKHFPLEEFIWVDTDERLGT